MTTSADKCIWHDDECPYPTPKDCGEMVADITAALRAADETFEKVGGGTRHYIRECFIHELVKRGLKIVRVPK